jgi:hypothetical protein
MPLEKSQQKFMPRLLNHKKSFMDKNNHQKENPL